VVPTKAYRNYVGSIAQDSSQYRLDLNLNVASLTNVLFTMRPSVALDNLLYRSLSFRVRNYLQNWYFQYGSTILPQTTGIQCSAPTGVELNDTRGGYTEAYNELMKARHNYSNANTNSMISGETFWVDTPARYAIMQQDPNFCNTSTEASALALSPDSLLPPGKFAGGIDLELVPGRSQDLICGMNTNGMNTSIYMTFDPGHVALASAADAAAMLTAGRRIVAARLDAWCEYDAFVNISPGIATTVSF
jgi:hypothetical protein